ncbi:hypothetical protein FKR81_13735 [Lentzea tibetensis]|uniref:Uncharacterized protein n=1 Tax=Lentzea tibetensis TaxID=2591470 RepID=A0A563EW21_9PSEU|nr:hypothetical protein [Lentzea tibetensis]TWP51900.1 hypothetical protein FKR81_13735 [Lentzea tibetensis]
MAADSAARMDDHRRQLATEIDRLEATEPGSEACRAAVALVEARLQAMLDVRRELDEIRLEREAEKLRPVNQVLGGVITALGVVAAVLSSKWLLVFLLPTVAVGVLLLVKPTGNNARVRLVAGVVAVAVALLCLVFGGAFGG